jgi:hypothetical protein
MLDLASAFCDVWLLLVGSAGIVHAKPAAIDLIRWSRKWCGGLHSFSLMNMASRGRIARSPPRFGLGSYLRPPPPSSVHASS